MNPNFTDERATLEPLHQQATELLLLERDRILDGPLVVFGDQDADAAEQLSYELEVDALQFYVRYASDLQEYRARGLQTDAVWRPDVKDDVRTAIVFLSREKEMTELRVAAAVAAFPQLQEVFLIGHNKLGAKSIHKRFSKQFQEVDKIASARHSALVRLAKPAERATDALDNAWRTWTLHVDGAALEIHDLPGVFSRGSLDRGSEMLLQALGSHTQTRVLDLGAGSGVLSLAYAARVPNADLTLVDHDAMAIGAANKNIERHGLAGRARAVFGDVESVAGQRFDLVLSNPPFHAGSEMTTATSERWFNAVKALLERGGEFVLVANQHLPYGAALERAFGEVNVIEEDSRYRVWRARKPR